MLTRPTPKIRSVAVSPRNAIRTRKRPACPARFSISCHRYAMLATERPDHRSPVVGEIIPTRLAHLKATANLPILMVQTFGRSLIMRDCRGSGMTATEFYFKNVTLRDQCHGISPGAHPAPGSVLCFKVVLFGDGMAPLGANSLYSDALLACVADELLLDPAAWRDDDALRHFSEHLIVALEWRASAD